jgi:hypothetical protein
VEKACATPGCGEVIPPQQGSARPRKYCTTCRPPRDRKNPRVIDLPDRDEPKSRPVRASLVETYRRQLEDAERLDTPDGALVISLATLFESGDHTASGAASLSRELRAAMEVALRGAAKQGDSIDELTARRRAKAASA